MSQPAAPALSRLEVYRGMGRWNLSGGLAAVWLSIVFGTVSTGYLLALGASNAMVGLLSGANSWGHVLQSVTPLMSGQVSRRKPLCTLTYALGYSVWLAVALVAFLPAAMPRAHLVIALVIGGGMLIAVGSPLANTWLADLVPQELRGRFVARQQSIMAAVGLVATLATGWYVDQYDKGHQIPAFQLLFYLAVAAALASVWVWSRVPEPPMNRSGGRVGPAMLLLPLRHHNFRNLTLFLAARTSAMMMAAPFFAVYMLEHLHISYQRIALYSMAVTISQIASNPFWGYLADKFGYKPLLRISTFGIALIPIPWFFTTPTNYHLIIPVVQMWGGLMGAGVILSQYNLMLKIAPAEHKEVYIGVHTAVVNLAVGLGSILGGLVADLLKDYVPDPTFFGRPITYLHILFLVSALLRFLGLSLLQRVREEPEVAARRVMREVSRGNVLRTLFNLGRMQRSADTEVRVRATRALGSPGNVLAVEELVAALDDSQMEVRREAARSLGQIADTRAVEPLVAKATDPVADIPEQAVEALGHIESNESYWALVQLLDDPRDAVRRSVAQSLGAMGDSRAVGHLEARIEVEQDPAVVLAVTEALSRLGGISAVHRLRLLLRKLTSDGARKQVAHSISHLLGDSTTFYTLLELDALRQEERVARLLEKRRRQWARWRVASADDTTYAEEHLTEAMLAFEHEEYTTVIAMLRQVASRTLHALVGSDQGDRWLRDIRADLPVNKKVGLFLDQQPELRLNFGFLNALWRACRGHEPTREEALLAVFAFDRVAGLARSLARRQSGSS
ncbi:MAG: MFS transporter [Armatimonadetes bacterium]|nr:MFS transporter [Armatimonadota bacterium]